MKDDSVIAQHHLLALSGGKGNISPPTTPLQSIKESRKEVVFMQTFDAICTIQAVRHFKDTPIPEPIVQHIIEAGRLTASGRNSQPGISSS